MSRPISLVFWHQSSVKDLKVKQIDRLNKSVALSKFRIQNLYLNLILTNQMFYVESYKPQSIILSFLSLIKSLLNIKQQVKLS